MIKQTRAENNLMESNKQKEDKIKRIYAVWTLVWQA
jgi:hypothetical protein